MRQPFRPSPKIYYVSYPSLDLQRPLTVSGQLRLPAGADGKLAAVVMVHGSSGVDSRGAYHAGALNGVGIATFEIDLWGARGLSGGAAGRPRGVPETLPDAYGALKYLAGRPEIDPARIGIMGFSWGGAVSMLTATREYTRAYLGPDLKGPDLQFAAHAPFYPVCWAYNRLPGYTFGDLTGAPVLIQAAELDAYDDPDSCPQLVADLPETDRRLVSVKIHPGATHAFDRLEPAIRVNDPFSHKGEGGEVSFTPSPRAAARSRAAALQFFGRAFGLVE